MKKQLIICFVTLFLAVVPAFADAAPPEAGKSLSVRTFQFKHKTAEAAATAIKSLRGAEGSVSITSNGLVVSDSPENLKKIAAALAAFDVAPQPFRLSIRLVSAGRVRAGEEPKIAEEIRDIAPKLALLRYNALENIGSADVSGNEGETGLLELSGFRADFKFGAYDPASDSIQLSDLKLSRREGDQFSQLLKTTLNLKLGQTVILSATRQPNAGRALMIVVSAKR
jgi:hypothetical protein